MQHFNHTSAESRLLSQHADTPRDAAESGDNLEGYTAELRRMTEELRKTYADPKLGSDAREEVRDTVLGTERSLDAIRGNLFESLRKLVPSLGSYVSLGGDGPSAEAGLSWQPDTGRLSFDATAYPDFRGGEYENGRGYSLDDPGSDAEFSALMGTPGSVNLLSLRGPHSEDPLPYTETEEPFYVAPSGLYPNPLAMLRPDYGTDVRRVRAATATGLDALRRSVRPYGTPGRDGFPPAPPAVEEDTSTEPVATGTPGRDGFPAAPSRIEEPAAPRRPAAPVRRPETVSTARLEKEMADARREYDSARREATEARRLPPGPDRTARLTRLAERMEGMVTRIETLEQEIKKLRSDIS